MRMRKFDWEKYTSVIGLLLLVTVSVILSDSFLTARNLMNLLRQLAVPGVLAIGMTFCILTGGIDLSVGGICALSSVLYAMMLLQGVPFAVAAVILLLMGAGIGLCYGLLIAKVRIPPFIATLAGVNATKGAALVITDGAAVGITDSFTLRLGSESLPVLPSTVLLAAAIGAVLYEVYKKRKRSYLVLAAVLGYGMYVAAVKGGIPYLAVISVFLNLIFIFVLNHTVFGKNVYAVGGNMDVARMAGVKIAGVLVSVYVIESVLGALGGIMTAARLGAGAPTVGTNWELDAIAAVSIGGTSMSGGSGKLSNTIIGVILIGVLNNMLSLLNVQTNVQMICKGMIILAAVVLDSVISRKKLQ